MTTTIATTIQLILSAVLLYLVFKETGVATLIIMSLFVIKEELSNLKMFKEN